MKRLFTALRFPEETINQIAFLQEQIKKVNPSARYVSPVSNFHLTLYYIGSTDQIDEAKTALIDACQLYQNQFNEPIELVFNKLGSFKSRKGLILWLGIKNTKPLTFLAKQIPLALKKYNIIGDNKRFKPHITLARNYNGPIFDSLELPQSIKIDQAALVWSHRNEHDTLVYDNLLKVNLIK